MRPLTTIGIPRFPRAFLALLLAAQAAGLLAPVATKPAEAAFPGANGVIAFISNRTTGTGVTNPTGDVEIFVMKPDGTALLQITDNTTQDSDPAWSADGQWLAYVNGGEIFMRRDIPFVQTRRLTTNTASDGAPTFSPDGTKIVFTSQRDGNFEIYVMDTVDSNNDGNGDNPTRLTNHAAFDFDPAWAPDGSKIAFISDRDAVGVPIHEIYVMDADGSDPVNLTNNPTASDDSPNWSPDGSKIVFTRRQNNNSDIFVMNADGSGQKRLTKKAAFDGMPAWSPDGTKIVFTSTRGGGDSEIYVMKAKPESKRNRPKARTNNDVGDQQPDWLPIP
jgi:Tol biopolymer transport system component